MTDIFTKPNYSIGIKTCLDLYEKLKFDSSRIRENDSYHDYDIYNFVVTAHHLNEWILKDKINRPQLSTKKIKRQPSIIKRIMAVLEEIANCNKHMHLDESNEKNKSVLETQKPEIRSWWSYYKNKPLPGITLKDGYLNIAEIESLVMKYFDWVFDDQISENDFPEDILKFTKYWESIFRP